jgi:hypothetical protein
MPIQPRAPTLRLKASLKLPSMAPPWGLKVPASISSARNARTSARRAAHSGGRRIGSKVSSVFMRPPYRAASMGQSASAPLAATSCPSFTAHTLSLPKSSRQAHSRRV